MTSTSPPAGDLLLHPRARRGEGRGGDCSSWLWWGEHSSVQGCRRHRRGQAGWRGEGSQQSPHPLPPGWWGAGASSPALPRGHSVLSCSVPALFVFLPRGWGWAGLIQLGAPDRGNREWEQEAGAAPHLPGSWALESSLWQTSPSVVEGASWWLQRDPPSSSGCSFDRKCGPLTGCTDAWVSGLSVK